MDTPRRLDYANLKGWLDTKKEGAAKPAGVGIVRESDLVKVGGLYRIRENYEAVWRMESSEDGKRYIVRADEGGAQAPERLLVTSETAATDSAKAAFKVIRAGSVYVAWECDACATPNLTKFGSEYECDDCHKKYADVLKTEQEQKTDKRTFTRAEVEPAILDRMKREGITTIHHSLLDLWEKEASGLGKGKWKITKEEKEKKLRERAEHPSPKHTCHMVGSQGECPACKGRKDASRRTAGGSDCPKCGDYIEPSAQGKHKQHCPGKKAAGKV